MPANVPNIVEHWPLVARAMAGRGILEPLVAIGAIGTIAIETASTFAPVREAYWLPESWRRANLRYYPYYGRGHVQLTWLGNYQVAEVDIPLPGLVANPDMALEPWPSALIFAHYFDVRGVAAAARAANWYEVRRRVLGAYDGVDRILQVAARLNA